MSLYSVTYQKFVTLGSHVNYRCQSKVRKTTNLPAGIYFVKERERDWERTIEAEKYWQTSKVHLKHYRRKHKNHITWSTFSLTKLFSGCHSVVSDLVINSKGRIIYIFKSHRSYRQPGRSPFLNHLGSKVFLYYYFVTVSRGVVIVIIPNLAYGIRRLESHVWTNFIRSVRCWLIWPTSDRINNRCYMLSNDI